jgi:hypothetical protein
LLYFIILFHIVSRASLKDDLFPSSKGLLANKPIKAAPAPIITETASAASSGEIEVVGLFCAQASIPAV